VRKLVVSADAPHEAIEQYRRLGAVMYQAQADRGTRVVMITSTVPAEGKSLTATNLALTLSESYRQRVLLIDADLRRPTLHDVFQIPNWPGSPTG
jgi:Mrp family chromosome partitioning ATPase